MRGMKANITKSLPVGANVETCDNSGAKIIQIISVKGYRSVKRRRALAGVGDFVTAAVKKGLPAMRKQIVQAVIVRQRKEYKRPDGVRIVFEDNAAVIVKDDMGTPKGTIFKGAIAKEVAERWPPIAKVASAVI